MRIIFKPHAHFQSMVKTFVKFQTNRNKNVGEVVHTMYPMSIHIHCQNDQVQIAKNVSKINLRIISKPHAHLQCLIRTSVKFIKKKKKKKKKKKRKRNCRTRYTMSINFHCQNTRRTTKLPKEVSNINLRIISKPLAHLHNMVNTYLKFQ